MPLWFHCDVETGAFITGGASVTEADARGNLPPDGQVIVVVPDGSVSSPFPGPPNFSKLREHLRATIDQQAGALRARYISDAPGQAQTYEKKENEARSWFDGDEVANPHKYPFMIKEAEIRGVPIEQVRDEIMEQVNLLTPLAALIEAHRIAAKQAVLTAATLPAIVAAGTVDWENLL
jgi:hypothetical protein